MLISWLTHHLKKCEVTHHNIIKVDFHIDPEEVASIVLILTFRHIIHNCPIHKSKVSIGLVDAPPKLPRKEVHAHDAEDEPEDEADEQDVHDGGDGTQQGIHHHLVGNRKGPGAPGCHPTLLDPASFCAHSGCVKSQWPWQGKNVINNTETLSTRRWG